MTENTSQPIRTPVTLRSAITRELNDNPAGMGVFGLASQTGAHPAEIRRELDAMTAEGLAGFVIVPAAPICRWQLLLDAGPDTAKARSDEEALDLIAALLRGEGPDLAGTAEINGNTVSEELVHVIADIVGLSGRATEPYEPGEADPADAWRYETAALNRIESSACDH